MLYLAHYGIQQGVQLSPYFLMLAGTALAIWGVRVMLDFENEDLYIEAKINASRLALRAAFWITDRLDLELMDEHEADVVQTVTGTRIYLAQRCRQ